MAGGRYHETDVDESDDHPWKLKNPHAMAFTMEEVIAYDYHLLNVQASGCGSLLESLIYRVTVLAEPPRNKCGGRSLGFGSTDMY